MPGEVMARSSPVMHMVGMGLSDAPASTRGSGGATATFLNCRSPASAATIRRTESNRHRKSVHVYLLSGSHAYDANARATPRHQHRRIATLGGLRNDCGWKYSSMPEENCPGWRPARPARLEVGRPAAQRTRARNRSSASGPSNWRVCSPDPCSGLDVVRAVVHEEGRRRGQAQPVQAELIDARIRLGEADLARDDHRVEARLEWPL